MLEKTKNIMSEIKADAARKRDEKVQRKKEQQKEAERLEQELQEIEQRKQEERLAALEAKIQSERNRLMLLSEKELLVEAILALKDFKTHTEELESTVNDLADSVCTLENDIKSLKRSAARTELNVATMNLK